MFLHDISFTIKGTARIQESLTLDSFIIQIIQCLIDIPEPLNAILDN